MLETVSPYALLRASIPRRSAPEPNAYDLYSLAQGSAPVPQTPAAFAAASESARPAAAAASQDAEETGESAAPRRSAPYIAPARRTHYIADIKTRHSSAALKATFSVPKG